jgi:hypothetical protein
MTDVDIEAIPAKQHILGDFSSSVRQSRFLNWQLAMDSSLERRALSAKIRIRKLCGLRGNEIS